MNTRIYTHYHYCDPETKPDEVRNLLDGFKSGLIKLNNSPLNCHDGSTKVLVCRRNDQIVIKVSKRYHSADMYAARYAQISTINLIIPEEDIPYAGPLNLIYVSEDGDIRFRDPVYVSEDKDVNDEEDEDEDIPDLI